MVFVVGVTFVDSTVVEAPDLHPRLAGGWNSDEDSVEPRLRDDRVDLVRLVSAGGESGLEAAGVELALVSVESGPRYVGSGSAGGVGYEEGGDR